MSIVQLNTVPWPQPVVTVRRASFSSRSTMPVPAKVRTCTVSKSQSTSTDSTSDSRSMSRWLRRYPRASASG